MILYCFGLHEPFKAISDVFSDAYLANDDVVGVGIQEFLDTVETVEEIFYSDTEEQIEEENSSSSFEFIACATLFGITLVAVSALLCVLRVFHPDLPKDARTLLKTPPNCHVKSIENGSYFHFISRTPHRRSSKEEPLTKEDPSEEESPQKKSPKKELPAEEESLKEIRQPEPPSPKTASPRSWPVSF